MCKKILFYGIHMIYNITALDPPSSVQPMGNLNRQAEFRWTPADSGTPVRYAVTTNYSTQCNPMTTDQATTSCPVSDPTAESDVVVCDFSSQSVACDNLTGNLRTEVVILQSKQ
jgi:hypothetical protein